MPDRCRAPRPAPAPPVGTATRQLRSPPGVRGHPGRITPWTRALHTARGPRPNAAARQQLLSSDNDTDRISSSTGTRHPADLDRTLADRPADALRDQIYRASSKEPSTNGPKDPGLTPPQPAPSADTRPPKNLPALAQINYNHPVPNGGLALLPSHVSARATLRLLLSSAFLMKGTRMKLTSMAVRGFICMSAVACAGAAGAPAIASAAGAPAVPKGFKASAMSWTSASNGWVLGAESCGLRHNCKTSQVVATTNGGKSWHLVGTIRAQISSSALAGRHYRDPDGHVQGRLDLRARAVPDSRRGENLAQGGDPRERQASALARCHPHAAYAITSPCGYIRDCAKGT